MTIEQSFHDIAGKVYADHLNRDLVEQYFRAYDAVSQHDDQDVMKRLQLRYYHAAEPWHDLNQLAAIYEREGRQTLREMCLAESLLRNPQQKQVLEALEAIPPREKRLPYPEKFPPAEVAVTVIMPTYNRTDEIRASIESVINQTLRDWELIVINDAGTDAVRQVVDSYNDPRIRYLVNPENLGVAATRNRAIARARGRHIAYLDDDDVYEPTHLAGLLKSIIDHNLPIAYGNTQAVFGNLVDGEFQFRRKGFRWRRKFDRNVLAQKIYIVPGSILHRRDLMYETGMFDPDLRQSQDWDLWLRFAKAAQFAHLDRDVCEYRLTYNNRTMKNRIVGWFYGEIVTHYHSLYEGRVALLKGYLAAGRTDEARAIMQYIEARYEKCIKTPLLQEELLTIVEKQLPNRAFAVKLMKDYFDLDARPCLRRIKTERSYDYLIPLFPQLFRKIIRGIYLRARKLLSQGNHAVHCGYFLAHTVEAMTVMPPV